MITYTINGEERKAKTNWQEVTLGEYVQVVASGRTEAVCLFAGLSIEEYHQANEGMHILFQAVCDLLETEPVGTKPEWLSHNLGTDSIGLLELSRKYLRENEEQPEAAFPFIYAVYRWPFEYDGVLAMSGAGFPQHLVEKANALPLAETIGAVYHILSEMNRLDARYGPILSKEPTEEQYRAGIDRFEKYGFYATLLSYCNNDLTKVLELMTLQADVFYTTLCIDTERADYEEKYREILNSQKS